MRDVAEYMDRQSRQGLIVLGYILLVLLGLVDHFAGQLSLEAFYLAPIFIVSWFGSRRAGMLMAFTGGLVWILANSAELQPDGHVGVTIWNVAWQIVLFLLFAVLISLVRSSNDYRQQMARTDSLTGMINSTYFADLANSEISRARRYAHPFTLTYIEFPVIGATESHPVNAHSAAFMRSVADVVRSGLRGTDMAARLDDTTFAVLLPETGVEPAKVVVQKLFDLITELNRKKEWQVTFGIGAVTFLNPPASVEDMMRMAVRVAHSVSRRGHSMVKHEVVSEPA